MASDIVGTKDMMTVGLVAAGLFFAWRFMKQGGDNLTQANNLLRQDAEDIAKALREGAAGLAGAFGQGPDVTVSAGAAAINNPLAPVAQNTNEYHEALASTTWISTGIGALPYPTSNNAELWLL